MLTTETYRSGPDALGVPERRGLLFVSTVGFHPPNTGERRFVQEMAVSFDRVYYLRGIGIKGLGIHQLTSVPERVRAARWQRVSVERLVLGSLFILPLRRIMYRLNVRWLRSQLIKLAAPSP